MTQQEIAKYLSQKLQLLQKLPEHPRKAALANLRRGVGRIPGDQPELWSVFLQDMPPAWKSQTGEPTREEWAVYLALTLYALHQQGHALPEDNMSRSGVRFGQAVRRLVKPGEDVTDSSVQKRFTVLATASDMREISQHLRGMIQLLHAAGIPLDYPRLAADLYELQFAGRAPRVRLRWGQAFYAPFEENKPENQQSKEREN